VPQRGQAPADTYFSGLCKIDACVLHTNKRIERSWRGDAESSSYQARCEVAERVAPCYRDASCAQKEPVFDIVIVVTGYTRKYAIGLLNQSSNMMGEEDARDEDLEKRWQQLPFQAVEWENLNARHTFFDPYENFDHSVLRVRLSEILSSCLAQLARGHLIASWIP
jgi:hypothetical protein